MPRGRKPKIDKTIRWKITIPQSVARATVHTLTRRNPSGELGYGDRSALFEKLLRRWLSEQDVDPNRFRADTSLDEFIG